MRRKVAQKIENGKWTTKAKRRTTPIPQVAARQDHEMTKHE
jgi:hypothetical protein